MCNRERSMAWRLGSVHHDMRRPFDYLSESTDSYREINIGNLTARSLRDDWNIPDGLNIVFQAQFDSFHRRLPNDSQTLAKNVKDRNLTVRLHLGSSCCAA